MSSALRRFITDHRGRVVVAQRPNGPMLAWSALTLLVRASTGPRGPFLRAARDMTLACWAGQELLDGDSPFRRTLGAATLFALAASRLRGASARSAGRESD